MDFEFDINIFGAPYSFDLYKGDDWALNYFSIFDNTSDEPVKMTVHRLDNKVMYNYLRYGYITSSGRPGSFFGISVGFKDSYCSDFDLIYQLFEGVFQTIIEKGVIFHTQNQYKIQYFTDAEDEINRIKRILVQNIRGAVAKNIKPLDFTNDEPDKQKAALLRTDAGNDSVWKALDKYAMVSISPNYSSVSTDSTSDNVEVIVPADVLMSLSSGVKAIAKSRENISRDVLRFQADFAKGKDRATLKSDYDTLVSQINTTISNKNNIISTIRQWSEKGPNNIAALKKLLSRISEIDNKPPTLRELADMTAIYKDKIKAPVHESDKENGFGTGYNGHNTGYGTGIGGGGLGNLLGKHRKSLLGIGAVVLIIIGFVVFYPKNTEEIPPESTAFEKKCDSLKDIADSCNEKYNWEGACDDNENSENHSENEVAEQSGEKKEKSVEKTKKPSPAPKDDVIIVYVNDVAKDPGTTQLPTNQKIRFVLKENGKEIEEGITIKDGENIIKCPKKYTAKDVGKHTISITYKKEQRASFNFTVYNPQLN